MDTMTPLQTENNLIHNTLTVVLRLALALVILPHGAQKLLGWFGGSGFKRCTGSG